MLTRSPAALALAPPGVRSPLRPPPFGRPRLARRPELGAHDLLHQGPRPGCGRMHKPSVQKAWPRGCPGQLGCSPRLEQGHRRVRPGRAAGLPALPAPRRPLRLAPTPTYRTPRSQPLLGHLPARPPSAPAAKPNALPGDQRLGPERGAAPLSPHLPGGSAQPPGALPGCPLAAATGTGRAPCPAPPRSAPLRPGTCCCRSPGRQGPLWMAVVHPERVLRAPSY